MTYHYIIRSDRERPDDPITWISFWIRRFFRIAPIYYLTLFVALPLGPWLGRLRSQIAVSFSNPPSQPVRFFDQGWDNILAHVSLLFGFIPHYHFRTPLPDWSIGLEMQFYMAIPFIMILCKRIGFMASAAVLLIAASIAKFMFADFMDSFEMPTILPLKINLFLSGMLIAAALAAETRQMWLLVMTSVAMAILPLYHPTGPIGVGLQAGSAAVLAIFALQHRMPLPSQLRRLVSLLSDWLGKGIFRFMGETSYSVYLIHYFIIIPVSRFVIYILGTNGHPAGRVLLCVAISVPVTYAIAWVLFKTVEASGIGLGRTIVGKVRRRLSVSTA